MPDGLCISGVCFWFSGLRFASGRPLEPSGCFEHCKVTKFSNKTSCTAPVFLQINLITQIFRRKGEGRKNKAAVRIFGNPHRRLGILCLINRVWEYWEYREKRRRCEVSWNQRRLASKRSWADLPWRVRSWRVKVPVNITILSSPPSSGS